MQWIPIIPNKLSVITGDVRSGKTTNLLHFSQSHVCSGFLTPDSADGRVFINLLDGAVSTFEVSSSDPRPTITIGRFHFLKETFDLGNQLIYQQVEHAQPYFIVDEWGLLESSQQGFNAFNELLPLILSDTNPTHFLVVVRTSLLGQFSDMVNPYLPSNT